MAHIPDHSTGEHLAVSLVPRYGQRELVKSGSGPERLIADDKSNSFIIAHTCSITSTNVRDRGPALDIYSISIIVIRNGR